VIALDTETTGISLYHGARPFFVTTCDDHGEQTWWEWDVDPLTREVCVPARDLEEVRGVILDAPELVLQNVKFDATALGAILLGLEWPWARTQDTLMAGHLLASNLPHALDDMALQYLGVDIRRYEETLKAAVQKARRLVQQAKLKARRGKGEGELASWQIAAEGTPGMPGVKKSSNKRDDKAWKNDCWLPRALCLWAQQRALQPAEPELAVTAPLLGVRRKRKPPPRPWWADYADPTHPWLTVLRDYANTDSAVTLALWQVQEQEIKRRCLWAIYRRRMEVLPVAHHMEARGITYSKPRQQELRQQYVQESAEAGAICVNIAASYGHKLELPRNGVNKSLREFMFQYLHLEPLRGPKAKTEAPTLNAAAMEYYRQTLPPRGKALAFIRALTGKRQRDTAITYLDGYPAERAEHLQTGGLQPPPLFRPRPRPRVVEPGRQEHRAPYPGLRVGRGSLHCPVRKRERPALLWEQPPAYCPPLTSKEFEACVDEQGQLDGRIFKKRYASTLYQRTKNGNFRRPVRGR
jgi:hypothetical protein